ncbi:MAG: glycoside hydrolase family 3 N-terminal domain-containing protein [Candidatus Zixiibacteriota bacterium]
MVDIAQRLGQLFILGFEGDKPSPTFLNFIREEQIGGVILFEPNCPTQQITRRNVDLILSACRVAPFIAVDQEGGRVCRIKGAPTEYRSASYYRQRGSVERFSEEYSRSAVSLEALGINLNLAPVADIFLHSGNSCLADRCFGVTPKEVTPFVRASVEVSAKAGLLCCLKHFPGLGAAVNDPHEETAVAGYTQLVWQQRERIPFQAGLEAGADMIMTTHMLLPELDDLSVTESTNIISTLIRKDLAFDGPVITDDLLMKGAEDYGSPGNRAIKAFLAGHDLLLFSQDSNAAMRAYDSFVDAVQREEIPADKVTRSLQRVAGLKCKLNSSVIR